MQEIKCNALSMMDQWQSFGETPPRSGHNFKCDQVGEIWVTAHKRKTKWVSVTTSPALGWEGGNPSKVAG